MSKSAARSRREDPSGVLGPCERDVAAHVCAPLRRRLLTVTGMDELGAYCVLRVADPDGPEPGSGQFAMLAAAERWGGGEDDRPYLPRAFSIARWHEGEAQFLLEDVGPGSKRLCELSAGEQLWALGPLGVGFSEPLEDRRALLVGGGVGIAPLGIWQDTLRRGATTRRGAANPEETNVAPAETVMLGFHDSAHAEGATLLSDARVASEDGSVGHHGLVTELLAVELDGDAHATVYACGPPGMLEAVRAMCAARKVPAQLALEAGMACGFGACFGCVVPRRGGGYLRVCLDGPVVDSRDLDCVEAYTGATA